MRGLKFLLALQALVHRTGRTLHECVDWNYFFNIKCLLYISRTLHECVDWNGNQPAQIIVSKVALYTSAWIEITPFLSLSPVYCMSHSTRVRGLKLAIKHKIVLLRTSHSTRVRGLKFKTWHHLKSTWTVALYTSAWIEICQQIFLSNHAISRTLHECVDWNII